MLFWHGELFPRAKGLRCEWGSAYVGWHEHGVLLCGRLAHELLLLSGRASARVINMGLR